MRRGKKKRFTVHRSWAILTVGPQSLEEQMRIGFAGMGIMGVAMAKNVLKAGFETMVFNRSREKCGEAVDAGAQATGSPAELARFADVLVLMLTGPEACDEVLFGTSTSADNAAQSLGPGKIVVNMSTVPPAYSRELSERLGATGAEFVDAPVAGSRMPAEQAQLVILAGGEAGVLDRLEPLFSAMGKSVVRCGPAGAGSMMKMANNLLLGVMVAGLSEMLDLGVRGGLDRNQLVDVVLAGPMACDLFRLKEEMFRAGEFPPQFPLKHMAKDLGFAVEAAEDIWSPARLARAVQALYQRAMEGGLGEEDFAAVSKALG